MLFAALYAFFTEHQYCGDLDGGVDGDRVWMTCTVINRRADDDGPMAPRGDGDTHPRWLRFGDPKHAGAG
jgi:hypothetical protein